MKYRYDLPNKTMQQRIIISKQDEDNKRIREQEKIVYKNEKPEAKKIDLAYFKSIFIKLGMDATGKYNGFQTMDIYQEFAEREKSVWFCTDAVSGGISSKMKKEFSKASMSGEKVYMYFAIGKSGGGSNQINYRAEVIDIDSCKGGILTPEEKYTPCEWKKIIKINWVKITNIVTCDTVNIDKFVFVNNGNRIVNVLNTNCHFGYIQEV